jgi:hypothetical protein
LECIKVPSDIRLLPIGIFPTGVTAGIYAGHGFMQAQKEYGKEGK